MSGQPRVIVFLSGPCGAGKTTTGEALAVWLQPAAFIDRDAIVSVSPGSFRDPWYQDLSVANMRALDENFQRFGFHNLVIAGVIEQETDLQHKVSALARPGDRVFAYILDAAPEEVERRIRARGGSEADIDWHVARAVELRGILASASSVGHSISSDGPLEAVVDRLAAAIDNGIGEVTVTPESTSS